MKDIRKVSIVGMGALGLLYGNFMNKAGVDVSYVMDPDRIEKYKDIVPTVNGEQVHLKKISSEDAKPADLLMVAVKYTALESALSTMKNCIGPNTVIMSVMNGITSEDIIGKHFRRPVTLYTVAQGMDAMKFGNDLTYTQMGALRIGPASEEDTEDVDSVVRFFESIRMPYVREQDINRRMWFKWMLNVGVNQTCMAYGITYGDIIVPGEYQDIMFGVMREVMQIANAKGIDLSEADLQSCIEIEKTLDPKGTPSMGQDRIQKRKSEVDMFAGTVISLGRELGIPTPANEAMYKRVKEIESKY